MSELNSHVTNSSQKIPHWYPLLAGVFPCGVLGQFLIAGGALYRCCDAFCLKEASQRFGHMLYDQIAISSRMPS